MGRGARPCTSPSAVALTASSDAQLCSQIAPRHTDSCRCRVMLTLRELSVQMRMKPALHMQCGICCGEGGYRAVARTGKSPQDSTGCQLTTRRGQCHISLSALAKVNTSVTLAASQVISSKSHFPQSADNERAQHTVTEGNIEISRLTFAVLSIYLSIYL